jgi:hypothetical protein
MNSKEHLKNGTHWLREKLNASGLAQRNLLGEKVLTCTPPKVCLSFAIIHV